MVSMRVFVGVAFLATVGAFNLGGIVTPTRANLKLRSTAVPTLRAARTSPVLGAKMAYDMEALIQKTKDGRLEHLEKQAMDSLQVSADNFENVVFPNACIAGDCVITHLLHRLDLLKNGKVKIMVVDTFHLFDETMPFVADLEKEYGFKAEVFQAEGCADKAEYDKKYGADLWKIDIEQYDKVCKVEPFQRGLKTLKTEVMINGRRRDHGAERAYIDLFENAPIGGGLAKVNPLAYWTFEDCFDYITKYKIPIHPLHADGYPSIGDKKDTVRVPEDGSVKYVDFKFQGEASEWLDYAAERKGRFTGLQNKDGSAKTECGIHVAGAEKTWDRDLWEDGKSKVKNLSKGDAEKLKSAGKDTLVVTYAPWCQFCQGMEEEMEKFAGEMGDKIDIVKYRGDEDREFIQDAFQATGFPTITLVDKDGKVVKGDFDEPEKRSVSAFTKFIKDNTGVAA